MDNEEEKGIEAIRYLQKMNGIEEPRSKALTGWRCMTSVQKQLTLQLHDRFKAIEEKRKKEAN